MGEKPVFSTLPYLQRELGEAWQHQEHWKGVLSVGGGRGLGWWPGVGWGPSAESHQPSSCSLPVILNFVLIFSRLRSPIKYITYF